MDTGKTQENICVAGLMLVKVLTVFGTHALILPWNIAPMLQRKLAHLGLKFYVPQVQTIHETT